MCTLVVAAKVVPGWPLVVVANRDEQLDRPASPPRRWNGFVAPRDEVAGGTWLGWNDHGVFAAITNRHLGPRDASRTSRGALVVQALACTSARAIHERMAEIDPRAYNGFHLVYADGRDVLATVSDGETLAQLVLGDGLTIVTERAFGAGDDRARVAKIRAAWARIIEDGFEPARATSLLTEHDPSDPLLSTCIHFDAARYGTRSAMVLAVPDAGAPTMLWAEGPPCKTPFEPVELGRAS